MGEGLSDLWGLAESAVGDAISEVQQQASAAMHEALGAVNENLQSAITSAPPEEHAALSADRDKVIEAYQVASSQVGQDEAAGQAAMDRVLAAAGTLGGKAAQSAAAAAAAQEQWGAKQEQLDEMALHVAELEDADHPKSEKLRELTETIREKANGRQYGDSAAAVDQLQPKLEAMMQEHQAMIDEAEAASGSAQEEGSWWDKVKETAEDAYEWATGDDDDEESNYGDQVKSEYGNSGRRRRRNRRHGR